MLQHDAGEQSQKPTIAFPPMPHFLPLPQQKGKNGYRTVQGMVVFSKINLLNETESLLNSRESDN